MFDRDVYFDAVRETLFGGSLTQQQTDGQNILLGVYERVSLNRDFRWMAYCLATTLHESASTMWPVAEYGGADASYGQIDPETGQRYYGRGFCQTTHRANYRRADVEMGWSGEHSCEWHADLQLEPIYAAPTMFVGMYQGWFRTHEDGLPETLGRYFNENTDEPYLAREIINGDKTKVPSWSGGVSIGNLIAGYHDHFLDALNAAIVP